MKERWLAAASTTHPRLRLIMCLCKVNLCYNASLLYVNDACSVHVLCVHVRQHSVYDPGCLKWCFQQTCTLALCFAYITLLVCLIVCRVRIPKRHAQTHTRTHAHTHMYTERVGPCCCVGFLFQEIPLSNRQEFKGAPSWHASWDNERLCLGLDCWLRIILQDKQATVQPRGHTWSTAQSNRWSQSSRRRPSCCLHFLSDWN